MYLEPALDFRNVLEFLEEVRICRVAKLAAGLGDIGSLWQNDVILSRMKGVHVSQTREWIEFVIHIWIALTKLQIRVSVGDLCNHTPLHLFIDGINQSSCLENCIHSIIVLCSCQGYLE